MSAFWNQVWRPQLDDFSKRSNPDAAESDVPQSSNPAAPHGAPAGEREPAQAAGSTLSAADRGQAFVPQVSAFSWP